MNATTLPMRLLPPAWAALVVTAGPMAASALSDWSPAPRLLASAMLWFAWAAGLVSSLAPRPVGLTVVRSLAALSACTAIGASPTVDAGLAGLAIAGTALTVAVAFTPAVGERFVNGTAYGSERRFPLRVPPVLALAPIPLALAAVGLGPVVGPLLLADGKVVPGLVACLVGFPAAALAGRSLYSLSQRWAVLVPGGLVLKDPLTLTDPILFPRDKVASLRPLPFPRAPAADILDLRLGAVTGSIVLELSQEADLFRVTGRRRSSERVVAQRLAFCPRSDAALLAEAGERRTAAAG